LSDIWRKRNPRGTSFTWSNADYSQASRLDRFLTSSGLFKSVSSNKGLPCSFSDHDFVDLNLSLNDFSNKRGGVWKFNLTLLSDVNFRHFISSVIDYEKGRIANFDSLRAWWDNLKLVIRRSCIDFSTRKHKSVNLERNLLTRQLIAAKNAFHAGDESVISEIKNLESALSSLILREAEGVKIQSRAK